MSLKSFDKFCESMILGEPGSQKEVFDERQNQLRTKLTIEALTVYVGLSALAVMFSDLFVWCEGMFPLMLVCAAVCFLYWTIRCACTGCLFGVKGMGTLSTSVIILLEAFYFVMTFMLDNDEPFVNEQGLVTDRTMSVIAMSLMLIAAIIVFVMHMVRKKKAVSEDKDN